MENDHCTIDQEQFDAFIKPGKDLWIGIASQGPKNYSLKENMDQMICIIPEACETLWADALLYPNHVGRFNWIGAPI